MSLRLLGHFFIVLAGSIAILILAKPLLIPLAFAVLFAFLLYPVVKFLEKKLPRVLSILIAFIIATLIIISITLVFGIVFKNIVVGLDDFDIAFQNFLNNCCGWFSELTGIDNEAIIKAIENNAGQFIKGPVTYFTAQLITGASALFSAMITGILAFLLLLYRTAFKNFIVTQIRKENRDEAKIVLKDMQKVCQHYLTGLFMVMGILGILNSLGLWIIGVKYPLFWGFFAAVLTIVPYVGTFIGGFMPFLFVLVTTTTFWQPAAIVVMFTAIQFLEDNFIKPKIVGNQVDLNPFVAIMAMLLGGLVWGVAGFVLALPYVAVMRIVLENFRETEPLSVLMSSEVYDKPEVFKKEYNAEKYSLFSLFRK